VAEATVQIAFKKRYGIGTGYSFPVGRASAALRRRAEPYATRFGDVMPWVLTYSFFEGDTTTCAGTWKGNDENIVLPNVH